MRPGTLLRWNALKSIVLSELSKNSKVLDIGSYDGAISHNLKEIIHPIKVLLVDTDMSGFKSAKKWGLEAIGTSALNLPIRSNSFDVILCLDLIEHIRDDSRLIQEVSRVLKVNGRIILTTPMQKGVTFPFLPKKYSLVINKEWGHIRKGYSIQEITTLLKNHQLIIQQTSKYFNYFSRLVYWLRFLVKNPLNYNKFLFYFIIKLEPLIKFHAEEHIIIAKKIK